MNELEVYCNIAEYLENCRTNLHLSKRQLSKLTGITPVYLREILRGDRKPSIIILISLCNAINIKLATLFSDLENSNKI